MLKFDLTIKKKNEIQKLILNFEIRLKQISKFEFYFIDIFLCWSVKVYNLEIPSYMSTTATKMNVF